MKLWHHNQVPVSPERWNELKDIAVARKVSLADVLLEECVRPLNKKWYHNPKATGANNGTSPANAWTHKRFWTVAKQFINILPLFLLMGCQSSVPVATVPKEINPMLVPAVIVARQPMGYEIPQQGGTAVYITRGPNAGSCFFVANFTRPTYQAIHTGTIRMPVTVQGSNDLVNWADLFTTNALDFTFDYRTNISFYRLKS